LVSSVSFIIGYSTTYTSYIGTALGGMGRPLKRDADGKPIYDNEYVIFQQVSRESIFALIGVSSMKLTTF
jgi:hypothetical protein